MGPTASGKSALAIDARRAARRRDRHRRLGAGLSRHGHRHRQAVAGRARARAASPDRHRRSHRGLFGGALRRRRASRHRRDPRPGPRADRRRRHDALLQGAHRRAVGAAAGRSRRCARSSTRAPRARAGRRCMPSSRASIRRPPRGFRRPTRSASSARSRSTASAGTPISALQGRREAADARSLRLPIALVPAGPRRAARGDRAPLRRDARRAAWSTSCAPAQAVTRSHPSMPSMRCVGYRQAWRIPRRRDRRGAAARAGASPPRASSPSASSRGCASTPRRDSSLDRRRSRGIVVARSTRTAASVTCYAIIDLPARHHSRERERRWHARSTTSCGTATSSVKNRTARRCFTSTATSCTR